MLNLKFKNMSYGLSFNRLLKKMQSDEKLA